MIDNSRRIRWLARALLALLLCPPLLATATDDATALQAQYQKLQPALQDSQFGRPLHLSSQEDGGALRGDTWAIVEHEFAVVSPALQETAAWCDILILHLNVKGCISEGNRLRLYAGRKFDQPLDDSYPLDFTYRLLKAEPDYLQLEMTAADGPVGTEDYRITLEAIPLPSGRSFLHLGYAYRYGFAARTALKGYLATIGRDKVGFSVVGRQADGSPEYVGGTRGIIERNTLRYYLAIDAWLNSLGQPTAERVDSRLQEWFEQTERYPLQLHEMGRHEYLDMKRKEIARQKTLSF